MMKVKKMLGGKNIKIEQSNWGKKKKAFRLITKINI